MKYFFFAIITLMLIRCSSQEQKSDQIVENSSHTVNDELTQVINHYYEVMSNRDWNAYRSHFWENATITTVWQAPSDSIPKVHVITIDEFIAETPNGPDSQPIFEERLVSMRSDVQGSMAVVWAKYDAKFGTQDSLMMWSGTDLFSLLRKENQWRIVSLTFEPEYDE